MPSTEIPMLTALFLRLASPSCKGGRTKPCSVAPRRGNGALTTRQDACSSSSRRSTSTREAFSPAAKQPRAYIDSSIETYDKLTISGELRT